MTCSGVAEEGMLLAWPQLALQLGEEDTALETAAAACQAMPTNSAAWQNRLNLQTRHATLQVSLMCLHFVCL